MSKILSKEQLQKLKKTIEEDTFYRAFFAEGTNVKLYNTFRKNALEEIDRLLNLPEDKFLEDDQTILNDIVKDMVNKSTRKDLTDKVSHNQSTVLTKRAKNLLKETDRFADSYFKYNKKGIGAQDAIRYHGNQELFDRLNGYRAIVRCRLAKREPTKAQLAVIEKANLDPKMPLDEAYAGLNNTYNQVQQLDYVKSVAQTKAIKGVGERRRRGLITAAITVGAVVLGFFAFIGGMPTAGGDMTAWLNAITGNPALLATLGASIVTPVAVGVSLLGTFNARRGAAGKKVSSMKNIQARNVYLLTLNRVAERYHIDLNKKKLSKKELTKLMVGFNAELTNKTYAQLYKDAYGVEPNSKHIAQMKKDGVITQDGHFAEDKEVKANITKRGALEQVRGIVEATNSLVRGDGIDDRKIRKYKKKARAIDTKDKPIAVDEEKYNRIESIVPNDSQLHETIFGKKQPKTTKKPAKRTMAPRTVIANPVVAPVMTPAFADESVETKDNGVKKVLESSITSTKIKYKHKLAEFDVAIKKSKVALSKKDVAKVQKELDTIIDTIKPVAETTFTVDTEQGEVELTVSKVKKTPKIFGGKKNK